MSTHLRKGGEVVYEALRALGVEHVFVVASVHNLPILDAIKRLGGITVVNVRHEQGAVHAADGYYRATGKLGVAITSTGPGAANSMGGLFEANFASSSVLMITGQIEVRFNGQGRGFIHEAEQQLTMLRTVTREAFTVRRVEDLGQTVLDAARYARTGRPRPVALEIPIDIQYACTTEPLPAVAAVTPGQATEERLEAAAELLRTAERPLIWAGGGVLRAAAWDQLRALAERLRIPVVTSIQGRGALPETHELCLGPNTTSPNVRGIIEQADVVLAVGTRFQMYQTDFWQLPIPGALIHVDVDPSVIGRTYAPTVSVVGDASLVLEEIDRRVREIETKDAWTDLAIKATAADRADHRAMLGPDHAEIVDIIRRQIPDGGAIVRDATVPAYLWGDTYLPIVEPLTSMNPTSAAIGPGLPLAIGATVGRGERSVVIHGDGGIMLTIGELAVLAQCALPLTVCVFNDGGYGVLRGIQDATFGHGTNNDVDLATPDFAALAVSMGVPAVRVDSVGGFDAALATSVASNGPFLIDIDLNALAPMDMVFNAQEILS